VGFDQLVDFVVLEGRVLDVYSAGPEGELDVLETGQELTEVSAQDRLEYFLKHLLYSLDAFIDYHLIISKLIDFSYFKLIRENKKKTSN
jgi:hypothetical protein